MTFQFHHLAMCASFGMLGQEPIYRPDEVTGILNCDIGHVYDLIKREKKKPGTGLRASNISTGQKPVWRIRHSAILEFMAENENTKRSSETSPQTTETPRPVRLKPARNRTATAKPVDTLRDKAEGLSDSFAARYAARKAKGSN